MMLTHLALLGLPEWTKLSKVQRQIVWQQCVHPVLARRRLTDAKGALSLLIVAGYLSWWMFLGTSTSIAWGVLSAVFIAFFPSEFIDMVIVARLRKRIGLFIRNHGGEIQSA